MKRASPIFILLLLLAGCSFFQTLEIYPSNVAGTIEEEFVQEWIAPDGDDGPGHFVDSFRAGYSVEWSVSGSSGPITVDYGDGITETITGEGVILIEHTYTEAGYYEAFFLRDRARGSASVTVRAVEFDLYHPFWTQGEMVGRWEEILFDPFPRIVHCSGEVLCEDPDSHFAGLWPDNEDLYMIPGPFGDMFDPDKLSTAFEMRIYVTTTDGGGGWAYGKGGEVITGWVPLQTYRVIADWPWAKPPYPLQVLQKGCDPDDPWIPPLIPDNAGAFLVRQETRRVSGGNVKAVQFEIYVGGACP